MLKVSLFHCFQCFHCFNVFNACTNSLARDRADLFFFSFFFFLQQTSALFQRSSGFRGPTIPGDSQHRGRALCFVRHLFHHGLLSIKERQV